MNQQSVLWLLAVVILLRMEILILARGRPIQRRRPPAQVNVNPAVSFQRGGGAPHDHAV